MERFWIPLFGLIAVVVQTTWIPYVTLWGISPDLVLLLTVFLALQRPGTLGLWLAFGLGLLQDVSSGMPVGLNALLLPGLAYAAVYIRRQFFKENISAQIMMVVLFTCLHQFLTFFWLNTLMETAFPLKRLLVQALGKSIYHALLAPWIFKGLSYCIRSGDVYRHLIESRELPWRRMG